MQRERLAPSVQRKLSATLGAMAAATLPRFADYETEFAPGRALVRRISGENVWVLYRFDVAHVDVLAIRRTPPLPVDDGV